MQETGGTTEQNGEMGHWDVKGEGNRNTERNEGLGMDTLFLLEVLDIWAFSKNGDMGRGGKRKRADFFL